MEDRGSIFHARFSILHARFSILHPRFSILPPAMDETEEVDVWWGAFAGRAMLPHFLLCGLLVTGIILSAWILWDEKKAHPQLMWHLSLALVALVGLVPSLRCAYLSVTHTYRLTTRRLLRDRGFRQPAAGVLDLVRVQDVGVEQSAWQRWVGVGRVRVTSDDNKMSLILEGVRRPRRVAALIRREAKRARRRAVITARSASKG